MIPERPWRPQIVPGDQARGPGDEEHPERVVRPGMDAANGGFVLSPVEEERLAAPDEVAGLALEPVIYDGVIAEPDDEPAVQRLPARVVGHVIAVQPSERTVRVTRSAAGHTATVLAGWHSWGVRAWDGLSLGVYRRQIRAAEAVGDTAALAEWLDRRRQAQADRHTRLMDLPRKALGLAKLAVGVVLGLVVLLVLAALVVWMTGAGDFPDVFRWAAGVIRWLISAAVILWSVFVISLPGLVVAGGWREGRRRGGDTPAWVHAPEQDAGEGREIIPDEGAILRALAHLGIADLGKALKTGWIPRFPLPPIKDGRGYHAQLELPQGVTVEMINKKKGVLAHNLVRLPVEVWPTEPKDRPGVLDLWIADQGTLTEPVGAWPLLTEGAADYFKGVPVAVNIRRQVIIGRLSEANYAIAGMMGSGKSTLIITILLGAMLDPLVEIDVRVLASNADYDPMKRRLRTLRTGPGDEIVESCLDLLREVYADLSVRGQALKDHNERANNRRLAERDERLRPRIIVIDECQALFMHEEMGEEAADLAVKLISAARKYGITLIFATPEASSASLPRRVMAVVSNKACFAIGDQTSNDAVLGTGSYKAGISATSLEPKTADGPGDIGTCMARGFTAKPGLLRSYYVAQGDVPPLVDRALALRERAGIGTGRVASEEPRDLLTDLAAVMGADPIPVADLPALLARLAPRWLPYRTLTGKALRELLAELGVRVPSTGNRYPVHPDDVRSALARREEGAS